MLIPYPPSIQHSSTGFAHHQQYQILEGEDYHRTQNRQQGVRFSLPGSSPASENSFQGGLQRTASQGPAPPRNVMMLASGGTAVLRGPSFSHNIHDPYAAQKTVRSGEVGRPSFNHLVGPSGTSSKISHNSKRTLSPSRAPSSTSPSQRDHLQAPSTQKRQLKGNHSIPVSDSRLKVEEGAEGPSSEIWSGLLMTASASNYSTGDFGDSFSAGFGELRASGRSDGSGGSGNTNGGRSGGSGSGGFGNGEGGSNGDGNDRGGSPTSSKEREKAARKANPLVDLIETETAYVAELGKIIKKVAGAWSRSNFPPAELDTMFRNIESIYRVNRSFLKSLKEIGPNPSSPRALGDLLMRWIDDLETPYLRYCDNYFTDFDNWPSVQTNSKLPSLLESVSESTQSDGTPIIFSDKKRQVGQLWTLDQLFALPQTRLKYYKKLYARLLKSTQTGRSDHRLLVGANEKLDELLQRAKKRIAMSVLDEGPVPLTTTRQSQESSGGDTSRNTSESVNGGRVSSATSYSAEVARGTPISNEDGNLPPLTLSKQDANFAPPLLPTIATTPSIMSQGGSKATSQEGSMSSTPRDSQPPNNPDDLEARLDTSRTLDIFSMKPKVRGERIVVLVFL